MTSAGSALLIYLSNWSVLRFLSRFTSTVINTGLQALAFDNDANIASFRKDRPSYKSGCLQQMPQFLVCDTNIQFRDFCGNDLRSIVIKYVFQLFKLRNIRFIDVQR